MADLWLVGGFGLLLVWDGTAELFGLDDFVIYWY